MSCRLVTPQRRMSEQCERKSEQREIAARLFDNSGSSTSHAKSDYSEELSLRGTNNVQTEHPTPESVQTGPAVEHDTEQKRKAQRPLWDPTPAREQLEAFFAESQEQARARFRDRWGFDTAKGRPLPEHENTSDWKWEAESSAQDESRPGGNETQ